MWSGRIIHRTWHILIYTFLSIACGYVEIERYRQERLLIVLGHLNNLIVRGTSAVFFL